MNLGKKKRNIEALDLKLIYLAVLDCLVIDWMKTAGRCKWDAEPRQAFVQQPVTGARQSAAVPTAAPAAGVTMGAPLEPASSPPALEVGRSEASLDRGPAVGQEPVAQNVTAAPRCRVPAQYPTPLDAL